MLLPGSTMATLARTSSSWWITRCFVFSMYLKCIRSWCRCPQSYLLLYMLCRTLYSWRNQFMGFVELLWCYGIWPTGLERQIKSASSSLRPRHTWLSVPNTKITSLKIWSPLLQISQTIVAFLILVLRRVWVRKDLRRTSKLWLKQCVFHIPRRLQCLQNQVHREKLALPLSFLKFCG